jgi:hypothetical protein
MTAVLEVRYDLASSTGIGRYPRSREELAEQLALLRLKGAVGAARAWCQLATATPPAEVPTVDPTARLRALAEHYERVNGRPLAAACPADCSCRALEVGAALEPVP